MSIESEFFFKYEVDEAALKTFGFMQTKEGLFYEKKLSSPEMTMHLIYKGSFSRKIFDKETQEEYTLFRLDNCTEFNREVRNEFISVLEDIRKNCCQ